MSRKKEETVMLSAIKRIYGNTRNETYLVNAVAKGYITEAQKEEIMAEIA